MSPEMGIGYEFFFFGWHILLFFLLKMAFSFLKTWLYISVDTLPEDELPLSYTHLPRHAGFPFPPSHTHTAVLEDLYTPPSHNFDHPPIHPPHLPYSPSNGCSSRFLKKKKRGGCPLCCPFPSTTCLRSTAQRWGSQFFISFYFHSKRTLFAHYVFYFIFEVIQRTLFHTFSHRENV